MPSSHLAERFVRPAEVEVQQVAKQGESSGSRWLPPCGPAEPTGHEAEEKQESDAPQQTGRTESGQETLLEKHLALPSSLEKNAAVEANLH